MATSPTITRDLLKVRAMYEQLESPFWMPSPGSWVWHRPDGAGQGFGLMAPHEPGLANLQWLALDMSHPPFSYDASRNLLYSLLQMRSYSARLNGEPLLDVAAVTPLEEFAALLPEKAESVHDVERTYPLLKVLAGRRLRHA